MLTSTPLPHWGRSSSVVEGTRAGNLASEIPGLDLDELTRQRRYPSTRYPERSTSLQYWGRRQAQENARLQYLRQQVQGRFDRTPARARIPWSLEEAQTLIELWLQLGNQWGVIKDVDLAADHPHLSQRTSVDLKDKMRNVKAWMIR